MNLKYFLLLFLIFSLVGIISSQECIVGEFSEGKYCGVDGVWMNLLEDGKSCFNNYECLTGSCNEGVCGSIFYIFENQGNFIEEIWTFFSGEECDPQYDTGYFCVGSIAYLCGVDYVWEEKGEVVGECGVKSPIVLNDDDLGGNNGGSSSSSSNSISILILSPKNITYGYQEINLKVKDKNNKAKYWQYSLNGDSREDFNEETIIFAKQGENIIEIYASKDFNFYNENKKEVSFNVLVNNLNLCGDGVCSFSETCLKCSQDCGVCEESSYCGDGVCDENESSYTCLEDCEIVKRKDFTWLFFIIVGLIFLTICFIVLVLIKKYFLKKNIK